MLLRRRAQSASEPVVAGEAVVDLFPAGGGRGEERQEQEKGKRGPRGAPCGGSFRAGCRGQEKYPQIVMIRKKKTKAMPIRIAVGLRSG
jgi:hypothetical protein